MVLYPLQGASRANSKSVQQVDAYFSAGKELQESGKPDCFKLVLRSNSYRGLRFTVKPTKPDHSWWFSNMSDYVAENRPVTLYVLYKGHGESAHTARLEYGTEKDNEEAMMRTLRLRMVAGESSKWKKFEDISGEKRLLAWRIDGPNITVLNNTNLPVQLSIRSLGQLVFAQGTLLMG